MLASAPDGSEHPVTDPGSLGERSSRLVPRPRTAEPDGDGPGQRTEAATAPVEPDGSVRSSPDEPAGRRTPGCQTDLPGWAGAHRHGAVRPSPRPVRRDRPPRRWC
ncbi:hypothetical protein ABNF97_12770 [Plantactinospora sp. B6F1]|uniref:hypothetical protein n=1 Tax=Plantactinospora sp. B6F1 TaxID=3158971 RepID=UPI0032D90FFE